MEQTVRDAYASPSGTIPHKKLRKLKQGDEGMKKLFVDSSRMYKGKKNMGIGWEKQLVRTSGKKSF